MRRKFYLNKQDGKLMGVCAGLADYTGIDALWIRVGTALAVLAGFGTLLIAYIIVGLVADKRPLGLEDHYESGRFGPSTPGTPHWRDRTSTFGDVENYYSASNPRLSREIDELR